MALPAGIATVTITGTLLAPDGTPAVGSVDFIPSVPVLYIGPKIVTLPAKVSAVLVAGAFPAGFKLPATDDTAGNPTSWTWRVVERITGGRSFDVYLAKSPATLDYSSLSPVPTSAGVPVVVGPPGPATAATTDASLLTSGVLDPARIPALPYDPAGAAASVTVGSIGAATPASVAAAQAAGVAAAAAEGVTARAAEAANATAIATNATAITKTVPRWAPTTTYTLGQQVVSPTNDVVSRTTAGTSGATYDPTQWTQSSTFVPLVNDAGDTQASGTKRLLLTDTGAAKGSMIDIEHWGDGSGGTLNATYGLDIHNRQGARMGLVGHQYSNVTALVQFDNTDIQPLIQLRNSNNIVKNPTGAAAGTSATGPYLKCIDTGGVPFMQILGRGEILVQPGADATGHCIEVVQNAGSVKRLFKGTMNGAAHGFEIVAAAGSAGFYPLVVTGYDYGPSLTTSQDGSGRHVLQVTKNGTGLGYGLSIIHKGTATERALRIANATGEVFSVNAAGQAYLIKSTAPAVNAAGGLVYVATDGSLHFRGPTTDTQLAPA